MSKWFQRFSKIFNGYIEDNQSDWKNRIVGKKEGILLAKAKGIKYIHVGYHRTGATFLQQEVFPKYKVSEKVFSDDVLCGRLFNPGVDAVDYVYKSHPKVKILIVIRSQPTIINSAYKTYIKRGGIWAFPRYTKEILQRKKYDYFSMVEKYIKFYGKKNCKVMIFEDLIRSPDEYIKNVMKFIGEHKVVKHDLTPKKPAPSNLYNEFLRYVNILTKIIYLLGFDTLYTKIFRKNKNLPSLRFRKFFTRWGITLDEKIFKKLGVTGSYQYGFKNILPMIETTYAANNTKLSNLIHKDLAQYKYPISKDPILIKK